MKNETQNKIAALEAQMAKIAKELAYFKAWGFLETLGETAINVIAPVFHSLYGETKPSFEADELVSSWSKKNYTKIVKEAISRCKRQTQCSKNPSWAKEAIAAAKIVDEYEENA